MSKKYDNIIGLGKNCEFAFHFHRVFGFVESSLLAWANMLQQDVLVRVLREPEIIFSGNISPYPDINMYHCHVTDIIFHGKKTPDDLKGPDGQYDQATIDKELQDTRERVAYFNQKQRDLFSHGSGQLYMLTLKKDDVNAAAAWITDLYKFLRTQNDKAHCCIVVPNSQLDALRKIEQDGLFIRGVNHFGDEMDLMNLEKNDVAGWDAIFAEFQPKEVQEWKKTLKFQVQ